MFCYVVAEGRLEGGDEEIPTFPLRLNERNLTILRRSELAKTRGVTKSSCCRVNPLLSWLPPPTLPLSLFPGIHLSLVELHFIRIYFQELAVTPNFWQVNWI